jgi:hypothetical protein
LVTTDTSCLYHTGIDRDKQQALEQGARLHARARSIALVTIDV